MTTLAADVRAWGIRQGLCGERGILPQRVIDAYMEAHYVATDVPAPTRFDVEEPPAPVDDDSPDYSVVVNAWDVDHATVIAQAAANLIGDVHASTKERILAALRAQGTCSCITAAIDVIEAM